MPDCIREGFEAFNQGRFDEGGSNLQQDRASFTSQTAAPSPKLRSVRLLVVR